MSECSIGMPCCDLVEIHRIDRGDKGTIGKQDYYATALDQTRPISLCTPYLWPFSSQLIPCSSPYDRIRQPRSCLEPRESMRERYSRGDPIHAQRRTLVDADIVSAGRRKPKRAQSAWIPPFRELVNQTADRKSRNRKGRATRKPIYAVTLGQPLSWAPSTLSFSLSLRNTHQQPVYPFPSGRWYYEKTYGN